MTNTPQGTTGTQLPLPISPPITERSGSGLTAHSTLSQAIAAFQVYMQQQGFTENTQQAFRLDMQLLSRYVGVGKSLGEIGTGTLKAFLAWMQGPRGVPCSSKTLERRITTLKVFFGWLKESEVLPLDPAAPIPHSRPSVPLPSLLTAEQIASLAEITQGMRRGTIGRKPDARPHLLFTLLLHTGIKKKECANIQLNHLDLSDAARPLLWIRYAQSNRRHKERQIPLPRTWLTVLHEYRQQYQPRQYLFPWTPRNLEYVLTGVAKRAGVPRLTFEMLRWTCAVRDFVNGMEPEALRHKLGLSRISWEEVLPQLALLADTAQDLRTSTL